MLRLLSVAGMLAIASSAWGDDHILGVDDLKEMHATYEANQARFMTKYGDRHFRGILKVIEVKENQVVRGLYSVEMIYGGRGFLNGDVRCPYISDKQTIEYISGLDKGDRINVEGTVEDHSFGEVVLNDCTIVKD